ncbi:UDP-glucuronosyl/UDP-glucosyltransferase [Artemisia annua]|uniref:UDP-glucuronosyl/UDP-glucosyltransferase n=1 Tax=Artemisia annua TaxID=35608 RepID=A0A2U1L9C6_ARTAN|nr:UDP-glucuronosyl/UDP-glucosyltransferase [Artemisia annua]
MKVHSKSWNNIITEMSKWNLGTTVGGTIKKLCLAAAVYYLWQERNWRLFKNCERSVHELSNIMSEAVRTKLMSLRVKKRSAVLEIENIWNASSGIIWNPFIELEEPTLETLTRDFPIPKFSLGPLQMYFPASPSSVHEQDRSVPAQAPKSVIYLSFGSIARITKLEFLEVAYGLVNIDSPFLWVVRPGVVKGSEWLEWLPEKFLEEVGDRGRIVKWCPQQEVLAHPSTGCSWTHSGWNSTFESICNEVPMICSPCVVGQPIIARYVNDIWKIGVLLEDGFERVGIERAVKRIMLNEEGEEIRQRISRVKKEVDISFDEGGSSHRSLKSLIDYISSF